MLKVSPPEPPPRFLDRVLDALLRLGAAFALGYAHHWLTWGLHSEIPENMEGLFVYVDDLSAVFYLVIYFYLLFDVLKLFVPQLNPQPYPKSQKKKP
jgi:hypothetical protein